MSVLHERSTGERDQAWLDALSRFMGDGTGPVPFFRSADGTVDAEKTVESAFGLYQIKPRKESTDV